MLVHPYLKSPHGQTWQSHNIWCWDSRLVPEDWGSLWTVKFMFEAFRCCTSTLIIMAYVDLVDYYFSSFLSFLAWSNFFLIDLTVQPYHHQQGLILCSGSGDPQPKSPEDWACRRRNQTAAVSCIKLLRNPVILWGSHLYKNPKYMGSFYRTGIWWTSSLQEAQFI